jgi:hypothetical protein
MPSAAPPDAQAVPAIAAGGVAGAGALLPHLAQIQASFGHHDVSGVRAHQGPATAAAARELGADAYAVGSSVAFSRPPDLHTAAHEAAHVVQQRGGVQLKGGIDQPGDAYERHADTVADAVVAGRSAVPLLDQVAGGGVHSGAAVQRMPAVSGAAPASADPHIAPPNAGIDKPGFIDNSDGANIRTGPSEAGGQTVRDEPLPPATRVFVSGTHRSASAWWYVTATLHDKTMIRGYVQGHRVNVDLPEPLAELRQLAGGETAEGLAKEKFGHAVTDGHDLRYYENVLLFVNQGRAGIRGVYQDPGVVGDGSNNIQLVAGHRIWLVSAEYAKALQSVVPSGSLTGGAVAKVKRFAGHLRDILDSVTKSRNHFEEVAGEFAQAIRDHIEAIVGFTAAFLMAEAGSMFLAAVPTGVSQAAAAVIQLALTAFGVSGMVQAGIEALKHGSAWLTVAWTAQGKPERIAEAGKEFLRMLVAIAVAALAYVGAKGNYSNALKIASKIPSGGLPAFATAGAGASNGAQAATATAIGPSMGGFGAAGAKMVKHEGERAKSEHAEPAASKEPTHAEAEAEAEFTAKLEKNVANEAPGTAESAREPFDLGNEWSQVQVSSEKVYRDTFRNEYVKARTGGEVEIPAKNLARAAARKATKAHIKLEGVRIARERAHADIRKDTNHDGVPDAFKNADSKAVRDFAEFRTGARGGMAKRLSAELPGKTVDEMEALLQKAGGARSPGQQGTFSTVKEGQNSYPQASYQFSDGTLVRIKPQGDIKNGTQPMYSVEMESEVAASGARPQDGVAFKMDSAGEPVPKGPDDAKNPYSTQQPEQRKAYDQEMIRLGHHQAKKQD